MNEPAFPVVDTDEHGQVYRSHEGMSLRDYFAAKAMQAMLANASAMGKGVTKETITMIAKRAYEYADAMLKARQQAQ